MPGCSKNPEIEMERRRKLSEASKKMWQDRQWAENCREAMRHADRDEQVQAELCKTRSKNARQLWTNDEYRAKQRDTRAAKLLIKRLLTAKQLQLRLPERKKPLPIYKPYVPKSELSSEELHLRRSIGTLKSWENPERREKQREVIKALWDDTGHHDKHAEAIRIANKRPERRAKLSEACRRPEVREKRMRWMKDEERCAQAWAKSRVSLHLRPNRMELEFGILLDDVAPGTYKYVGDGSLNIGRKCPDFVSSDNTKLIEFYGDYWHDGEDPSERIDYFAKHGYKTLIVWQSEYKADIEEIKCRVRNFTFSQ